MTTTLRLPPRIARLPQLRRIMRGGLAARGSIGAGLAAKAGGAAAGNGLLNNLTGFWPMNEAAGANNALDAHANALTLTQTASPGSAAGIVYAGARTFNGSSQYFSRASEALLQTGDVDFTIAAWIYIGAKAPATNSVIAAKDNATSREWYLYHSGPADRMRWLVYPGASTFVNADTFGSPPLSTWFLLFAWHEAAAKKIYISINSGAADSTTYASGTISVTNTLMTIGVFGTTNQYFWNGRIGPVAMWKSAAGAGGALDATKRAALWNSGNGLAYSAFTT